MNYYSLILIVAGTAGCLLGLLVRWAVISRLPSRLQRSAANVVSDLFGATDLRDALSQQSNFENIRPLIEHHIDEFLRHRLTKEMPMIGMFIGDKTTAQLKAIFMKELEEIFPLVIGKHIGDLSAKLTQPISQIISRSSEQKLRSFLNKHARKEMMMMPLYGAMAGLAIGILQIFIILLVF